jgi:hypothetical protein
LLLLDKDSRVVFWPLRRIGLAGLLGMMGCIPYVVFRLHHPVPYAESAWLGQLAKTPGVVLHIAPMTIAAFLFRRFVNNDFAAWNAPDNQHAVWAGKWTGVESLVDQATLGVGWACLLLLVLAWLRGGKPRWIVMRLFLVFLVFTLFIGLVWSTCRSNPLNYHDALDGSGVGGRYLYPALMSWFVAGFVLLVRAVPDQPDFPAPAEEKKKPRKPKLNHRAW